MYTAFKKDLLAMPDDVVDVFGFALRLARMGKKHDQAKPLKGFGGASVLEVVEDHMGDTYRAVYTVKIADEVYERVPGTRPAKDQFSRLYDIAVDFREEPPLLGFDVAERIREIFESHGARAKVSSIHVNAWFGDYDKLSMAGRFIADRLDLDVASESENLQALFCGDSPNDEPMFAAFRNSVAVANIAPFVDALDYPPAYVTRGESADGFVELVEGILSAR